MTNSEEAVEEPETLASANSDAPATKGFRKSFTKTDRSLSDKDLGSIAVQKMLLDDVERLEYEVERLKDYEDSYHKADKDVAVYKERFKTHTAMEVLTSITLALGSVFWGVSLSQATGPQPDWTSAAIGSVLVIGSVIVKWVKL